MSNCCTLFLVFIFTYASLPVLSQQWESVGGSVNNDIRNMYVDTLEDKIYIVGSFTTAGGQTARKVAAWDGTVWTSLNNNTLTSDIRDITKYKGELIVSGSAYYLDTNQLTGSLAKLTPSGWQSFNPVLDKGVALMDVIDDELYLVCCFDSVNGLPIKNIAKWNGTVWDSVGIQSIWDSSGSFSYIATLAEFRNKLVAAGNFNVAGLNEIAQWDGTQWLKLADGIKGESWINKIITYKDVLYVGGWFQQSAGNPSSYLMAWDGSKWFNPFPNVEYAYQVPDLNVIENELYVVGNYQFINDNKRFTFAKYDGENFCAFGGSFPLTDGEDPQRIAGLNGEIYVACNRTMFGDTLNYFAKWIGTEMDTCIYSPMASVKESVSLQADFFEISPNPATNSIQIKWEAKTAQKESFVFVDQLGKKCLTQDVLSTVGSNVINIDISKLANGVYLLETGDKRVKVVKE